ncbi:ribonuclease H-like [Sorex fumeus]|uniref:ribonuclease H-like n=1 Tax=Sorex fumeus TaxID=62283 RepID=UPI0024ACFD84|nr:ribonuclease H-like [Sorex fumeus]
MIEQVYSSRTDLKQTPLDNPDETWFTDGSSLVPEGTRKAAYAIVSLTRVVEAEALPGGTSAQKAELIALTRACQLAEVLRVNIYTDSKYAFLVLHAHAAIWKERGFLTAKNCPIKHGEEILRLLEAVHAPKEIAVMHCKGHQKGDTEIIRGNRHADTVARKTALDSCSIM